MQTQHEAHTLLALATEPLVLEGPDFESKTARGLWLIDFGAPWCAACKATEPGVRQLAHSHAGRLKVAFVDTDAAPDLADRFGVMTLPTLVLLADGVVLAQRSGAISYPALVRWVETTLGARAELPPAAQPTT